MAIKVFPLKVRFSCPEKSLNRRYSGSAWRGAFGHALKKLVCIFKHGHCENCPLAASCAYTLIFESHLAFDSGLAGRGVPAPYTLHPVIEGHGIHIHMTLIGERARSFFPFVLHALRLAGERGVAHIPFEYEAVECFNGAGWQALDTQLLPLAGIPDFRNQGIRIHMLTPARFKYQGHFATPETLSFDIWTTALRRRLISLAAFWGEESSMRRLCEIPVTGAWQSSDCRWQEMERYSSRQKTAMKMGGVMGDFDLAAEQAKDIWPLLWLGQWVHIGKLTTMGLGRYEILPLKQEGEG